MFNPPPKRRRTSLSTTFHARNGGSDTSFLAANTPGISFDGGSDTEDDNDEETAQHYLDKMTDDTNRPMQTVFGFDVDVWKSYGGTVYADVNEQTKKQLRDLELWGPRKDGKAKAEVEGGKRKREEEDLEGRFKDVQSPSSSSAPKSSIPNLHRQTSSFPATPSSPQSQKYSNGTITYPTLPPIPPIPEYPPLQLSAPVPKPLPPPAEYRQRTQGSMQFNRGSAGIDPLGAYNRPIQPLRARALRTENLRAVASPILQQGTQGVVENLRGAAVLLPRTPEGEQRRVGILSTLYGGARRIVSGSFGSFEAVLPHRFDGRAYRLGPKGEGGGHCEKKGEDKGDGKPSPFKGSPWLRH
ncbi:hypothetical protein EJ02DRAFT_473446 [Clathrospora elynae]|uniref:Uncharacterized protein n=1 Tax=Clathrospora elynae TaxID=706981 RepID=A0A6A5SD08_9PLEO|nr:hypothetical protein EJ02DRAFT_473446 [Clathrospora elynae]